MKYFFFFILLFPFTAPAQVVKDSTWQTNEGGVFFETTLIEWANGEFSLNKQILGDTGTLFRNEFARFEIETGRMANIALEAKDFGREVRELLKKRDSVIAFLGVDITDTMAARYGAPLLATGWKLHEADTTLDVLFSVNAQGQLRYQIAGYPVRNAFHLGRALRLQNFKDIGGGLDVFIAPGGNLFDITGTYRFRFPGNPGLNRSADKSAPVQKAAESPKPKTASKPKKKKAKN